MDLSFQIHSHATTWHVSTKDYSGSLVELSHLWGSGKIPGATDLRHRIAEWIRGCDAMLVLIPADLASQTELEKIEFRRALEALLKVFHTSDHPGPLPVCLAVTKSDMLPSENGCQSHECEPNNDWPLWIHEYANLACNQVGLENAKVFLTSAFGGHAEGDETRPPASGPRPERLEEPLAWALQESDRCLFEAAEKAELHSRRWPHKYKKAIGQCKMVTAKGMPSPNNEKLQDLMGKLGRAYGAQRKRRTIFGCCAVLAVIAVGTFLHAYSLKQGAEAAITTDKVTRESLREMEAFLESCNPACSTMFQGAQVRTEHSYNECAKKESGRIETVLAESSDDPDLHWRKRKELAKRRVEACREFCNLFPNTADEKHFQTKQRDANTLIADLDRYGPFDDAHSDLIFNLKKELTSVGSAEGMNKSYDDFCVKYPRENFPLKREAFKQAEELIAAKKGSDEYKKLISRGITIREDYGKDSKTYSKHLEAIKAWQSDYSRKRDMAPEEEAALKKQAAGLQQLIGEIETEWDREDYENLRTAAGRIFEGDDRIKTAIEYGDEYLRANRGLSAMKDHVRDWQTYARALMVTSSVGLQAYYIRLWNSKFKDAWGNEHIKVVIQVRASASSDWEQWHSDVVKEVTHEGKLESEPTKFSVPLVGQIKIAVTNYHIKWDDFGSTETNFLKLIEGKQAPGDTTADATINIDGAILNLKLTGLPKRKDLIPYEKPNQ